MGAGGAGGLFPPAQVDIEVGSKGKGGRALRPC